MISASEKATVGRADLLRMLGKDDEPALEKMAFALGYQRIVKEPSNQSIVISTATEVSRTPPLGVTKFPNKSPKATFFYIAKRERKQHNEKPIKPDIPEWLVQCDILEEDACAEPATLALPVHPPLIRWPRMWPFLRKVLGQHYQSRKPDIPRLIDNVARGFTVRQLPMQTQHSWSSKICLLLDFNSQTEAYYHDFNKLESKLKKTQGALGFDVRVLEGEAGLQTQYRKANENEAVNWGMPAFDTPILILTDLGLLADSPRLQQGWERFGRRLRAAGFRPQVLCPVPESLQNKTLQGLFTIHSWDRNNRLRGQAVNFTTCDETDKDQIKQSLGVETLLVLLSIAVVIEPGLLRAVRLLLPVDLVNVADEAGFWQHPDINSCTQGCCFKTQSGVNQYQHQLMTDDFWSRIKLDDISVKKRLISLIQNHHAYLPQSVRMMEVDQCDRLLPGIVDKTTRLEIKEWKQAMAKTCYQQTDHQSLQAWNQQYIAGLPVTMLNNPQIAALWALAQKQKLLRGEIIHYPDTIDKQQVDYILTGKTSAASIQCRLFQSGTELRITETGLNQIPSGSYYADLMLEGDLSIETEHHNGYSNEGRWQWQNSTDTFRLGNKKVLVELEPTIRQFSLTNHRETLVIKNLTKPDWASQIGRDAEGLWIEFEQQGKTWRVYWPAWGGELGYDQYGLYNDLKIKGVIQRSRFITPGTFQMGSAKLEKERRDNEIKHQVTLTQGYWLADTVCTQALWLAVMSENPARFNEYKNNPVETVSWDDVQAFLKQLNSLIPGLDAQLPSEAQWEYACRAGTYTPFSFGDNITPEQVNYHGDYPYAGGKKGLYREKTVQVKSLSANAWGLYEMHGNVLEWCHDWYGDYSETAVTNPAGTETGPFRVLRGGSWIGDGRYTRSAYRGRYRPDRSNGSTGFRFAPGQAKSREAEPEVAASERGSQ